MNLLEHLASSLRKTSFKAKIVLQLILTLTLSSCHKDKDPNYPESITIEASDATPELQEIKNYLENLENNYKDLYQEQNKNAIDEQKIAFQKIQANITKIQYLIREIQGTMFIDEYNKKIAELQVLLKETDEQLTNLTTTFVQVYNYQGTLYLLLAA